MNAPVRDRPFTPAPEQRRRFTVDEVERMYAAGVLANDEKVELVEGEIVAMSPKHRRHEHFKTRLTRWLARTLPDPFIASVAPTLFLAPDLFVEPDIMVTRDDLPSDAALGADVLLLIEVADTSLAYDLGPKRELYARHGVAEYWVVDAQTARLFVHRSPSEGGYGEATEVGVQEPVAPLFAPDLALVLADVVKP